MLHALNEKIQRRTLSHFVELKLADRLVRRSRQNYLARNHPMVIYANDYIGIHVNQFGFFEREELNSLFEFLAPVRGICAEGLALDIGANIGNHSAFFAKLFRHVHSFEPHPSTFQLLNLNASWLNNVSTHPFGLGDEAGFFELSEDPVNLGLSSLKHRHDTDEATHRIRVERLDDCDIDMTGLCFVKMDVEGFESSVIRGATGTLSQHQPLIVFEQHESEFGADGTESISLLRSLGYRFCWHEKKRPPRLWLMRRLSELKEVLFGLHTRVVTAEVVPQNSYTMLIAVPPRFHQQLGFKSRPD